MPGSTNTYLLMLVEGDTEEIFYGLLKNSFFRQARSKVINLNGNWSIEKKILVRVTAHATDHPDTFFSVAICIDRESRNGRAPIDLDQVKRELSSHPNVNVDEVILFEAVQDIESWFFIDIKGIYEFLRTPQKKRKPEKYSVIESLNHTDLSDLFQQVGKEYRKGRASRNFLSVLDLDLLVRNSRVLAALCNLAKKFLP